MAGRIKFFVVKAHNILNYNYIFMHTYVSGGQWYVPTMDWAEYNNVAFYSLCFNKVAQHEAIGYTMQILP